MTEPQRSNFAHLASLQADLAQLGGRAERFFAEDPNTCLLKLRQFAELMAQQVAARAGLYIPDEDSQITLLNRLRQQGWLPRDVADLFHWIRKAGNEANHELHGTGSPPLSRTLTRRPIEAMRSVHVEAKEVQRGVQARCG